jgi:hypothetical protein
MPTRLDLPSADDLAAMIRAGATAEDLAFDNGCSIQSIMKVLHANGYGKNGGPKEYRRKPGYVTSEGEEPPPFDPKLWIDDALCIQIDSELFFPNKGESTRPAKAVCARCTVREPCLADALATHERYGIRGGLSERERRKLEKAS